MANGTPCHQYSSTTRRSSSRRTVSRGTRRTTLLSVLYPALCLGADRRSLGHLHAVSESQGVYQLFTNTLGKSCAYRWSENGGYGCRHGFLPFRQEGQAGSVARDFLSPAVTQAYIAVAHVQTRDNAIVNRLNKTKVEKDVDHEAERQERLKLEGRKKKSEALERVCSERSSTRRCVTF